MLYIYIYMEREEREQTGLVSCFTLYFCVLCKEVQSFSLKVAFIVSFKSYHLHFSLFPDCWLKLIVLNDWGNVTRLQAVPRQYDSLKDH